MRYLFKVGITPHLASREISSYLSARKIKHQKSAVFDEFILIETKGQLPTAQLISDLGGTIFIGTELENVSEMAQISVKIVSAISKDVVDEKVNFAAEIVQNSDDESNLAYSVKKRLTKLNIKSRFVEKPQPIQLLTQKILYFLVLEHANRFCIFNVTDVTPVLDWQKRDRERPAVDAFSGVMPPKVSRMLLNLGINKYKENLLVFDPFCGSGTMMMETMMLGCRAIGSDISSKAVHDSQMNLDWFTKLYPGKKDYTLLQAEAQTITPTQLPQLADYIVSEGYLGPTRFKHEEIPGIIEELKGLYSNALPNLYQCLKPGGRLLLALPKHNHRDSQKMLSYLIDTCENSGYTLAQRPLEYSQPSARVKRAILMLDKL